MHETQLARQLLEVVLREARTHALSRVARVRGFVAETEHLDPAGLDFHFRAHARGTAAEGARLELELRHVEARCSACATVYAPEHHLTLCPACGGTDATLLGRTGVGIEALDGE